MKSSWDGKERRDVDWREITDHMATTNETLNNLVNKVTIQNGRVTKLENWRWFVAGICAAIILLTQLLLRSK